MKTSILNSKVGPVTFQAPYFEELISQPHDASHKGRLTREPECHACWYYFLLAAKNLKLEKDNLVPEDEISHLFPVEKARKLMESVALMYATTPGKIVRYWDACDAQRIALGYSTNADIPERYKFRFNSWSQ